MMGNVEIENYMAEGGSVKSSGPRTESLGSEKESEKLSPNLTFCLQFVR